MEAAPGGGPVLQFVVGAEGAAQFVGVAGEAGGEGAAPVLRALQVEADLESAGLADGPDFVVQAGVAEVDLEGGEDDAGLGVAEVVAEVGKGGVADEGEEVAGAEGAGGRAWGQASGRTRVFLTIAAARERWIEGPLPRRRVGGRRSAAGAEGRGVFHDRGEAARRGGGGGRLGGEVGGAGGDGRARVPSVARVEGSWRRRSRGRGRWGRGEGSVARGGGRG